MRRVGNNEGKEFSFGKEIRIRQKRLFRLRRYDYDILCPVNPTTLQIERHDPGGLLWWKDLAEMGIDLLGIMAFTAVCARIDPCFPCLRFWCWADLICGRQLAVFIVPLAAAVYDDDLRADKFSSRIDGALSPSASGSRTGHVGIGRTCCRQARNPVRQRFDEILGICVQAVARWVIGLANVRSILAIQTEQSFR